MVYQIVKLKEWKKEIIAYVWLEQGVDLDKQLSDNLIIDNTCPTDLTKNRKIF